MYNNPSTRRNANHPQTPVNSTLSESQPKQKTNDDGRTIQQRAENTREKDEAIDVLQFVGFKL